MTQEKALEILKSGENAFITGSAGTGKTFLLNQFIDYLKKEKIPVGITASTGIAATHINGMTIHSWCGIGIKDSLTGKDLMRLMTKKHVRSKVKKAKVLIIDEISMLHRKQLDLVNRVLQFFHDNLLPFGGIQVVFCGDFFQLPPVSKNNESSREKFAFMADSWVQANLKICYLTHQYRQKDNDLNRILNEIRNDAISSKSIHLLDEVCVLKPKENGTKLFTHNADVDRINQEFLSQIEDDVRIFKAKTTGEKKLIELLKKSVLAKEEIELKIGAKVMFVKNNYEKGYINGTLGTVTGYTDKGLPRVKLLEGKTMTVTPELWSIDDERGVELATFNQIPLRLAWAITIHKSQGMTLDEAEIDLRRTFEPGQGYVALSRLKQFDSLSLLGYNATALQVDRLALKADKRFRELSEEVEKEE